MFRFRVKADVSRDNPTIRNSSQANEIEKKKRNHGPKACQSYTKKQPTNLMSVIYTERRSDYNSLVINIEISVIPIPIALLMHC